MSTKKEVIGSITWLLAKHIAGKLPGVQESDLQSAIDSYDWKGLLPLGCLQKAGMDEPVFILRARDPLFTETVQRWAIAARRDGLHEPDKVASAVQQAHEGWQWRQEWLLLARVQKETE